MNRIIKVDPITCRESRGEIRMLFITIIISTMCVISCKKSTEPVEVINDPRQYTWTADTLEYPGSSQTIMTSIWGSSSRNVYTVGHNSLSYGVMWHFNGTQWSDIHLHTTQGGNIQGAIDLAGIHGFSTNEVWAVGEHLYSNPNPPPNFLDSSLIIHYDGSTWQEMPIIKQQGLETIWGDSPNRMWAGGHFGSLYKYDGLSWQPDTIHYSFPPHRFLNILSIAGNETSGFYMVINIFLENELEYFYLFQYENNKWVARDSTKYYIDSYTRLWMSPSGKLYAGGNALRVWNGSSWSIILGPLSVINVFGTDDENIFVAALTFEGGKIFHYNGKDWYDIPELTSPGVFFSDTWSDGQEAFAVGHTLDFPQKTVVFRGR